MNEEVASRIRLFAMAKFGAVDRLAAALEMAPTALRSNLLSGRSLPSGETLRRFASLGCDVRWLLTGEGYSPSMSVDELKRYIEQLEAQVIELRIRLEAMTQMERQFKMETGLTLAEAKVRMAEELMLAEPSSEYTPTKKRKKK